MHINNTGNECNYIVPKRDVTDLFPSYIHVIINIRTAMRKIYSPYGRINLGPQRFGRYMVPFGGIEKVGL